jgi:2-polyprenyl-6-hydroxyphenyl methylase/3-demethylubiquinone-9 3-methyltransferase
MEQRNQKGGVAYHDQIADSWEERYQDGTFKKRYEFARDQVLAPLEINGQWLDAGCGTGTFSRLVAARLDTKVLGVDASSHMISRAREIVRRSPITIQVEFKKTKTIESLPFLSSSFDGCICLSVLEYVGQPQEALSELNRVLKPGGLCVLSLPHAKSFVRRTQVFLRKLPIRRFKRGLDYLETSVFSVSPAKAGELFSSCGFVVRSELYFDPYLSSALHGLLTPSLIYYVLGKPTALKSESRLGVSEPE